MEQLKPRQERLVKLVKRVLCDDRTMFVEKPTLFFRRIRAQTVFIRVDPHRQRIYQVAAEMIKPGMHIVCTLCVDKDILHSISFSTDT